MFLFVLVHVRVHDFHAPLRTGLHNLYACVDSPTSVCLKETIRPCHFKLHVVHVQFLFPISFWSKILSPDEYALLPLMKSSKHSQEYTTN